jgi:hypothetical protein
MEEPKSKIRSVFLTLTLAALIGCLVLVIIGDWKGSLVYLDIAMLSFAICVLAPNISSRIDAAAVDNNVWFVIANVVWTFTIIIPFVLIAMKQGRLMMLGILFGLIFFLVYGGNKDEQQTSKNRGRLIFLTILLSPHIYALVIWFNVQLIALFLLLIALNIIVYTGVTISNTIRMYKVKEDWLPLKLKYPEEEPVVLLDEVISIQYPEYFELGFVETRRCELQATLHYEIDGISYEKNDFRYNWIAPYDNRLKEFNYNQDLKGQKLNLIYAPQNPNDIAGWLGSESFVKEEVSSSKQQQRKYHTIALCIAVLGFFLFFFKIAVT